jgi:hypothetical protein
LRTRAYVTIFSDARPESDGVRAVTRSLEELIAAARLTPPDLSFEEFEAMLWRLGWEKASTYGADGRAVWLLRGIPLTIQPDEFGRPRPGQVKLALDYTS